MKTVENITFESIDKSTPEGQLLVMSICLIGFLCFQDKKPSRVLDVVKDIYVNPLIDEPLSETMKRVVEKFQAENN